MTYGRADRAGCPGARAAGRGNAASLGCCGVRCGLGLDLRRPDIRACPLCSRSPVSAAARFALARNPSASGDTLWRVGKRALVIFRRPPVLVRRRRTADMFRAVADAGTAAVARPSARRGGPHAGVPVDLPTLGTRPGCGRSRTGSCPREWDAARQRIRRSARARRRWHREGHETGRHPHPRQTPAVPDQHRHRRFTARALATSRSHAA